MESNKFLLNIAVAIFFCPFVIFQNKKEVPYDPDSFIEPDVGQALPSSAIRYHINF
jgi:hypothetical protein